MTNVRVASLALAAVFLGSLACSSSSASPEHVGEESAELAKGSAYVGLAGKCLDDNGDRTADGTKVQLWTCNGTSAQRWTLTGGQLIGPGGKCLDVTGNVSTSGTPVELWTCWGGPNQQWTYDGGQLVGIGGKCLDVRNAGTSDGTQVQIYDCNGSAAQQWNGAVTVADAGAPPSTPPTTPPTPPPALATFYGINGHVNQYTLASFATTRALLLDLGITVYRNDVVDAEGAANLAQLATAFAGSGISILAVMTPGLNGTDEGTNYAAGYALGETVAGTLKGLVTHYECGNELENDLVSGDGNTPGDIDATRWPAYRGLVRGMIDGVKAADPSALVAPSASGWLHFGPDDMLWNGTNPDGSGGAPQVRWDFTTWHWYSDMGDIENATGGSGTYDVLAHLQSAYGKPIWLTEYGIRPTTLAAEAAYIGSSLPEIVQARVTYDVENVSWYELFDDQAIGGDGNYGLIDVDGTTKKPAYGAMKSFIAANPVQ